tara:strand:- start:895 stop:1419 length:525 start_codon:yes stop_codon:yes gene_type:complete
MTTSIVFKDQEYGVGADLGTSENDICYNYFFPDDNGGNSGYDRSLIDPSAAILALQEHRYLKTRLTGDEKIIPDTTGRDRVEIDIDNNYMYERLKMRRKYETLQYNNVSNVTQKNKFANIVRTSKLSNKRIQTLIDNNTDINDNYIINSAINSGVKNDKTKLYLDNDIKFYSNI